MNIKDLLELRRNTENRIKELRSVCNPEKVVIQAPSYMCIDSRHPEFLNSLNALFEKELASQELQLESLDEKIEAINTLLNK